MNKNTKKEKQRKVLKTQRLRQKRRQTKPSNTTGSRRKRDLCFSWNRNLDLRLQDNSTTTRQSKRCLYLICQILCFQRNDTIDEAMIKFDETAQRMLHWNFLVTRNTSKARPPCLLHQSFQERKKKIFPLFQIWYSLLSKVHPGLGETKPTLKNLHTRRNIELRRPNLKWLFPLHRFFFKL